MAIGANQDYIDIGMLITAIILLVYMYKARSVDLMFTINSLSLAFKPSLVNPRSPCWRGMHKDRDSA